MSNDQVLPPRIWAHTDSGKIPISLLIDRFIVDRFDSGRHPKFIYAKRYVQIVTRRATEVAFYEAVRAQREKPAPIANDFDRLETLGTRAETALDAYVKYLEPSATCADDLRLSILTTQAGLYGDSLQGSSALWLHLQASDDAHSLWRAREVLRELKEAACRKSARVRIGHKKSDRAEFLQVMAEAWIYLTKHKPGVAPQHSRNPFLRFAKSAWDDVFEPKDNPDCREEFIGALLQLPSWSDAELDQLKTTGPYWLRLLFNLSGPSKSKPWPQ